MLSLLASFSLLLPLAVSTPLALPEPVADIVSLQPGCELTFGSLFSAGTGCPQGSVRLDTYQNDRTRLIFYDMHAKVGDDVLESENYKTCDMSIDVTFPKGCFYTGKFDVERRGRTSLTSEAISARSEFGTTMSGTNQRWDTQAYSRKGPTSQQWDDWVKTDSGKGPTELWWSLRNGGTGTMKFKTSLQMSRNQYGGYGEMELNMLELRMT